MTTLLRAQLLLRNDAAGDGHFGASRGSRTHNGIDFAAVPGTQILSPVDGVVTKHGYPYGSGVGGATNQETIAYRYVEVMHDHPEHGDLRYRFFYVLPIIEVGSTVDIDQPLGLLQDVTQRYLNQGMTPHCHFEVKREDGSYVDPSTLGAFV